MKTIEYGITEITVGNDNIKSKLVKFGDGKTRISTVFWDGELSGLQLCRSDKLKQEPFKEYKPGDDISPNSLPEEDKVYIIFDNEKSIDVMINRLIEARDNMRNSSYGVDL